MRIIAIVPSIYDTSPGQRYRLEQWEPGLRRLGVEINFASFEDKDLNAMMYTQGHWPRKIWLVTKAFARRAALMRSVRDYDAVYITREASLLGPPIFERWINRSRVPIVFDFDDAIFVPYKSPANGILSLLKMAGKTRAICRLASHVIVGNDYLASYASEANRNVTIVPSTIDTDIYTVDPSRDRGDPPVIGWTGSYSTLQHLETLVPVLRRLAQTEPYRLRVIGPRSFRLDGVPVDSIAWQSRTEAEDLWPVSIGVMPLPENEWTRGKCGMKALQYMGLGIPTVCSPIGVNRQIIRDGENGFLADAEDEWVQKLVLLLRSPALRKRIGLAGRKTVEEKYSAAVQVPRVYDVFRNVVESRSPTFPSQLSARQARTA